MTIKKIHIILLTIFALTIFQGEIIACSMYKITVDGKTMVGCNHDAWLITPKIWFENAKNKNEYGTVFTGSREISPTRTTPQSGMNTVGLVFSRLASYHPLQKNPFANRQKITNEADYLSEILHKCATVGAVKKHIEQYDHSLFLNDVFIYVDSLGDYLIVEPYNLIDGKDSNYVLANFCPSRTNNEQARQMERYRNGEDFLKTHKAIASVDFCTALSGSMSVCRNRKGDGTLITSIFDTKKQIVNVYFYHNFDTSIQYNLTNELSKGDYVLNLSEIFPKNREFEELVNFKTPSNTIALRISMVLIAGLLALISFALFIVQIRKKRNSSLSTKSVILFITLNILLIVYMAVLITNKSIFYFDVPFKHHHSNLISATSYTPFLLLLLFIPITSYTRNRLTSDKTKLWFKTILVLNNIIYFLLVLGFGYWGLYNFWN
ncbi:MAG: hypothetical protein N4A45_00335 [Flavobacteriales bacterium]|jgi:hypothetical protein|nr:hypothetical protein [Flavobacteriales bacterium]